jgi:glutathione synthase/RimK-type ligase-like ATP-grasp enzyme
LSADLLVQRCAARGVSVFRFNSEDYPERVRLHVDPLEPETARLIRAEGDDIVMGRARGIWLRRPQWPIVSRTVTDKLDRQLAMQEAIAAAGGAWRLLAHLCVSPPDALQAARWKLPQLRRARALGLQVPPSLVTSNRAQAQEFMAGGSTVIKAIQDAHAQSGSSFITGFTEHLESNELDGIEIAPVFLQRQIEKVADYRVTLVGGRLFAAKTTVPPGAHIDVRASRPNDCLIEPVRLDSRVEEACVRFARDSGLRYAAFDLAEDQGGAMWFLESNPNGQWGWIEAATGQPITDALVDVLLDSASA